MTRLKLVVELNKVMNNLNILKSNYQKTGDTQYSIAYTKMAKIYNEMTTMLADNNIK